MILRRRTRTGFRLDAELTAQWRRWRRDLPAVRVTWDRAAIYIRMNAHASGEAGVREAALCLQAAQKQRLFVDRRDVFIQIARGNEAARPALDGVVDSGATTVVMLSPSRLARDVPLLVRRLAMLSDAGMPIVFADGTDVTVFDADDDTSKPWKPGSRPGSNDMC